MRSVLTHERNLGNYWSVATIEIYKAKIGGILERNNILILTTWPVVCVVCCDLKTSNQRSLVHNGMLHHWIFIHWFIHLFGSILLHSETYSIYQLTIYTLLFNPRAESFIQLYNELFTSYLSAFLNKLILYLLMNCRFSSTNCFMFLCSLTHRRETLSLQRLPRYGWKCLI